MGCSATDKPKTSTVDELIATVVNGGYCSGCGACAAQVPEQLRMTLNEFKAYVPVRVKAQSKRLGSELPIAAVCPFSDQTPDESEIADGRFGAAEHAHTGLGKYRSTWSGTVNESDFRIQGSSGGMTSWVAVSLLRAGKIDAVIHVVPNTSPGGETLFEYGISRDEAGIRRGAKSRYYPVEMSDVIEQVLRTPGRYAFIGLPCFVTAVHHLRENSEILRERIVFTISLFCGHLKSARFADYFGWECGIPVGKLDSIDFRHKLETRPPSEYGVRVTSDLPGMPQERICVARETRGGNWGYGLFKLKACDYCDDLVGETADISLGDAWLPQFMADYRGTNVVIVRNAEIEAILQQGNLEGNIQLDPLPAAEVAQSQAAGLRHRKEGLAYRLDLSDQAGIWRPRKRVMAGRDHLNRRQRKIFELRETLREMSHQAFLDAISSQDLSQFHRDLNPILAEYDRLYCPRWPQRVIRWTYLKLRRFAGLIWKRVAGKPNSHGSASSEPARSANSDKGDAGS